MVAFALIAATFQDFVNQKQIREQRAQMDRRVQIVDHRGSYRGQSEHEPNGRERGGGILIDDANERVIRRRGCRGESSDTLSQRVAEAVERGRAPLQVLARLPSGVATLIGGEALRGVREKILVRLFDGVAAGAKIQLSAQIRVLAVGEPLLATRQRPGS